MRNKNITTLVFFSLVVSWAYTAQAQPWDLDSCISYAQTHSISVRQAILQREAAKENLQSAKDKFLPTVAANVNQSWDFGRGLTSENTYSNRNTSSLNGNLGLSLGLFEGMSRYRQLECDQAHLTQILEQVEAAKEDISLNIMAQYLQVVYAQELHYVAVEQVRISQVELDRQEILLKEGKVAEADVIQARSQVVQDQVTAVTTENDRRLALINLAKLMELDDVQNFDIAPLTPSQDIGVTFNPDSVYNRALETYHAILGAKAGINLAEKNISLAKTGYLPKLTFQAGLGTSYYTLSGASNPSFGRQVSDNFAKSLSLSLSVPIFDAFSTRNQVRQAKIQKLSAELDLDQQSSNLFKAIRQAYYEAVGAEKKLESTDASVISTKAALEAITTKYEYGKATSLEFEQAKTNYIKALAEHAQAKYELILKRKVLAFYNK